MKVAFACPTVGQTRRGYESHVTGLFRLVRDEVDATLFKGGGASEPDERVLRHLRRTGILNRLFADRFRWPRYHLEFVTFAAALFPHLVRGGFDLVYIIDPPLARALHAWRRIARGRFAILFTSAGPQPFDPSRWVDHVHCVSPVVQAEMLASGIPARRLTMIPPGIDPQRFETPLGRDELRRRHGVPDGAFVILAVTSLNRHHKRVDYLIEEASRLHGDALLWIDAGRHPDGDASLLDLASSRLGERCMLSHVPSENVGELYKLADVLVSTAVSEPFGLAVVEAMCCGLPVLVHDSPHFRWLVGDRGHLVDMRSSGSLSARLARLMEHPAELRQVRDPQGAVQRFQWHGLKAAYLEMFRRAREAAC